MLTIYPPYYKQFSCIADLCPDTCCAGWEVVIDKKFQSIYKNSDTPAAKLATQKMYTDKDGDVCLELTNGRCPMLNSSNLCMLYIDMGSDALCDVCRIYPRFFKEANDYTIAGISLSCPEAARIILNDDSEKIIDHTSILNSDDDKVFFEIYNALVKIITSGKFFDCDFEKLCDVADEFVFNKAEFSPKLVEECFINETDDYSPAFARLVAEAFPNLEYLTLELPDLIEQFKNLVKDNHKFNLHLPKADKLFGEIINSKESQNLAIYYLYKYMWEAIEDGDIELWIKRACTMARLVCELYCFENTDSALINWQRYQRLAQLVSKEVEHNIDNLEIFDNFCIAGM